MHHQVTKVCRSDLVKGISPRKTTSQPSNSRKILLCMVKVSTDVRFYFLRDLVTDGIVEVVHRGSVKQLADIITKSIKLELFLKLGKQLGVCSVQEIN